MSEEARVLCIFRSADIRERIETNIERENSGLDVVVETDPTDALAEIASTRIDCVVSAYRLPEMDGIALSKAVRSEAPDLPVVLFVEDGSETIASEAFSAGVTDYVRNTGEEAQYRTLASRISTLVEGGGGNTRATVFQRRFDAIFEDPKMLVGVLDPDGTLLKANRRAMTYVEADREDVIGESFWETPWWTEELRGDVRRWVERAATGEYVEYDADLTTAGGEGYAVEGTIRPVTHEGEVVSLIVSARDVTERRETTRELERKDRAMDEAPVGILITDPDREDNPIVYANDEFERLTGYSKDEAVGRNCRFLQGPGTEPGPIEEMRAAIDAEEPITVELRNYRKDGTQFWNRVSIAPVREGGEVTHYVGFQEDVTDRKRREQHLQVLYRILRHNLRNGINVVDGYAARILEAIRETTSVDHEEVDHEEVEQAAVTIREKSTELATIANKTRRLKRVETASPTDRMPVSELFARVHDSVRTEYSTGTIDLSYPDTDVLVPRATEIAVLEAVENAFEHHDGDYPRVELGCDVVTENGARVTKIRIADDGPGIPDNERTPIATGRETTLEHASSVGLWLIKWTTQTLDGDLSVTENDPRGSVLTITLPHVST